MPAKGIVEMSQAMEAAALGEVWPELPIPLSQTNVGGSRMTPERFEEIKKNVDLWLDDDDGSVLALIIALEGALVEIEVLKESFGMAAMERVMADNHDLSEGIDGMIADREYFEKIAEQAEAALEKEIEASEFWRVRHEEAEADRDKWMGQFDEAEHRGLAYMEERDKLAAKLKEYEAFNEPLRRTYNENTAEEATS